MVSFAFQDTALGEVNVLRNCWNDSRVTFSFTSESEISSTSGKYANRAKIDRAFPPCAVTVRTFWSNSSPRRVSFNPFNKANGALSRTKSCQSRGCARARMRRETRQRFFCAYRRLFSPGRRWRGAEGAAGVASSRMRSSRWGGRRSSMLEGSS
jgi:hypothetical protein